MKQRDGFVSNSSSSSFIIGYHKNLSENEIINILENIELFKVSPNHALYEDMKHVCRFLVCNSNDDKYSTYDEYVEDVYFEDYADEEEIAKMKKLFEDGFILHRGSVSDEDCSTTEAFLSKMTFTYQDENVILQKDESR